MHGNINHIDLILDATAEAWLKRTCPAGPDCSAWMGGPRASSDCPRRFGEPEAAMSLLALLVGAFSDLQRLELSIVQRRNLMGRLRALSASLTPDPSPDRRRAVVLGIFGTLLGSLLGVHSARPDHAGGRHRQRAVLRRCQTPCGLNAWSLAKGACSASAAPCWRPGSRQHRLRARRRSPRCRAPRWSNRSGKGCRVSSSPGAY